MAKERINPRILVTPKANKVIRYLTVLEDAPQWKQYLRQNGGVCSKCSAPCMESELCIAALSEILRVHKGTVSREIRQVAEYLNDEFEDVESIYKDEDFVEPIVIRRIQEDNGRVRRVLVRSNYPIDMVALYLTDIERDRLNRHHGIGKD
ncbi:hypothetical protein APY94_00105 [Thermococcus celericrescens]|uniref:Uncharacterized protein n=2 Tax=Thermococcus celericrescens TaxID=227598 RepID=A0A100XZW1_9EURY|nr:hypothetical protein APY94_00105 [Thermococcus celericrescens]